MDFVNLRQSCSRFRQLLEHTIRLLLELAGTSLPPAPCAIGIHGAFAFIRQGWDLIFLLNGRRCRREGS